MRLEVLAIVHVIYLAINWILPWLEEKRSVLNVIRLTILAHSPLFLLKKIFMVSCGLHITIFEGALVGSSTRIRRGHLVVQPGWEVVHLDGKV